MHSQLRPLAWAAPCALGFCAYAAILLTDGTEELSWIRFTIAGLVLFGVSGAGAYVLSWTRLGRRIAVEGRGPDCDRCGKPTRKPFLYNMPRTHWRCEPCERDVTAILFADASRDVSAGLDEIFRLLEPPTNRTTEK